MSISVDEWLADPTGEQELRHEQVDLRYAIAWHLLGEQDHETCPRCVELAQYARELQGRRNRLHVRKVFAQCDETCTADCGACKGDGHPGVAALARLLQTYGLDT